MSFKKSSKARQAAGVVHYLMGRYGVSQRRAVRAARFWRSSLRYESRRDPLTTLRQRMREPAQTRVRFGYRRLLVVMHREGWEVGKHRFYRLYTEEGLALQRKRPWRHATAVHREQRRTTVAGNEIWSMDFLGPSIISGSQPAKVHTPDSMASSSDLLSVLANVPTPPLRSASCASRSAPRSLSGTSPHCWTVSNALATVARRARLDEQCIKARLNLIATLHAV